MAVSQLVASFALDAGEDLSAKLNYLGHVDTDGDVVLAGNAEDAYPIIEAADTGYSVTLQYLGIAKVIAGESLTPGQRIASDASGKAVAAAAGDYELGTTISTAATDELVSYIMDGGRAHA